MLETRFSSLMLRFVMIKASFLCHPEFKYDIRLPVTLFDRNLLSVQFNRCQVSGSICFSTCTENETFFWDDSRCSRWTHKKPNTLMYFDVLRLSGNPQDGLNSLVLAAGLWRGGTTASSPATLPPLPTAQTCGSTPSLRTRPSLSASSTHNGE